MISVCMATFNGERYIKEQIESVLDQSTPADEIVIYDDCSTDKTVEIIQGFDSDKIRLFRNNINMGVQKTFSSAIAMSRGDLIFLADQDDIWLEDKVEIIAKLRRPGSRTLYVHNVELVDKRLNSLLGNKATVSSSSFIGLFFKNKFIGATMAFEERVKDEVLMFMPKAPMHDWWIALIVSIIGDIVVIQEPLIKYRRHMDVQTDYSTNLVFSFKALKFRWQMLVLLIRWWFNFRLKGIRK